MSGGTVVFSSVMTSPFFSGGESLRGSSATYCSPIADVLCTCASRSDGMSMPDFSDSTASTPVSVRFTAVTRPTSVPR